MPPQDVSRDREKGKPPDNGVAPIRLRRPGAPEPEPAPGGNIDVAVAFLAECWPTPWLVLAMDHDTDYVAAAEFDDRDQLRGWLRRHQGRHNIYFSPSATPVGLGKKAKKTDITACRAAWVDIDPPEEEGVDLRAFQDDAIDRLKSYPLRPSIAIRSGNGVQALWMLTEPMPIAGTADIARFEAVNRGLATALKGDLSCCNIDRLMRVAGTVNIGSAAKRKLRRPVSWAEIVWCEPERRYRLAQFAAAAGEPEAGSGKTKTTERDTDAAAPELDPELDDELADIIRRGYDPQDPERWRSRSEAVFFVTLELIRAFWSDRRIVALLLDRSNGISAHIYDQHDPQRAARQAIEHAHEELAKEAAEPPPRRRERGAQAATAPTGEWPVLAREAYHGLAGDIARAIEPISEADPVAVLAQALAMFGCAFGRNAWVQIGGVKHFPNLFEVICGITAKSRKGTSFDPVENLFIYADLYFIEKCMLSGLASGEGIIHAVHDDIWVREKVPQGGKGKPPIYQSVLKEPSIADKRLCIVEQEFALPLAAMQRHGNTLSAIIRLLWDGRILRTATKNNPETATDAHGAIIGHISDRELVRLLHEVHLANGFGNRFLFILSRRSKEIPFPPPLDDKIKRELAGRLGAALEDPKLRGEITFDQAAHDLYVAEYHELSSDKAASLFGHLVARAEAQTKRLAMIYALLDRTPVIRIEHLRAALALWRYCEASAKYIFGYMLGDPLADEILLALRQRQTAGMTRTEINSLFSRNRTSGEIGQALALLFAHGLATMTRQGGGRRQGPPVETWHAV
jgi:hypothetical protein